MCSMVVLLVANSYILVTNSKPQRPEGDRIFRRPIRPSTKPKLVLPMKPWAQ